MPKSRPAGDRELPALALLESVAARLGQDVLLGVSRSDGDPRTLQPSERVAVERSVPRRQREFAAGRTLAKRLLVSLGVADPSIPAQADRSPIWPAGVVGSISHSEGVCVALVARATEFAAVGIDLEPDDALEPDLWPQIAGPEELAWVSAAPGSTEPGRRVRWIFSAKECAYKCQYGLTGRFLGFHDVAVTIDERNGSFCARIPSWGSGPRRGVVEGILAAGGGGWVLCAAALRLSDCAP